MQIYTFCITLLHFFYTKLKKLYICGILTKQNYYEKFITNLYFITDIS
jgi:hypothetical protein